MQVSQGRNIMDWAEYYRRMCHCFFLFMLFSLCTSGSGPILTHHNGLRADSSGCIKEPVSDCRLHNTLLSLLCQDRALEQTEKAEAWHTTKTFISFFLFFLTPIPKFHFVFNFLDGCICRWSRPIRCGTCTDVEVRHTEIETIESVKMAQN